MIYSAVSVQQWASWPGRNAQALSAEMGQTSRVSECTSRGRRDSGPRCLWCGLMGRTGERVPQLCVSRICDGGSERRDKQLQEMAAMKAGRGHKWRKNIK